MCEFEIVCVSVASMYFSARSIDHSIPFSFFPRSVRMFHFPPEVTVAVETIKETVFLIVRERQAESGATGDLGLTFVVSSLGHLAVFLSRSVRMQRFQVRRQSRPISPRVTKLHYYSRKWLSTTKSK